MRPQIVNSIEPEKLKRAPVNSSRMKVLVGLFKIILNTCNDFLCVLRPVSVCLTKRMHVIIRYTH